MPKCKHFSFWSAQSKLFATAHAFYYCAHTHNNTKGVRLTTEQLLWLIVMAGDRGERERERERNSGYTYKLIRVGFRSLSVSVWVWNEKYRVVCIAWKPIEFQWLPACNWIERERERNQMHTSERNQFVAITYLLFPIYEEKKIKIKWMVFWKLIFSGKKPQRARGEFAACSLKPQYRNICVHVTLMVSNQYIWLYQLLCVCVVSQPISEPHG